LGARGGGGSPALAGAGALMAPLGDTAIWIVAVTFRISDAVTMNIMPSEGALRSTMTRRSFRSSIS
jgi:hypothetical protein